MDKNLQRSHLKKLKGKTVIRMRTVVPGSWPAIIKVQMPSLATIMVIMVIMVIMDVEDAGVAAVVGAAESVVDYREKFETRYLSFFYIFF